MFIERFKGLATRCFVVFAICMLVAASLPGQRAWHQGDMWLKWKSDTRDAYLLGFVYGFRTGSGGNRDQSSKVSPPEVINTVELAKSITDFYTRYPGDRELNIQEIIEQIWNGLTLEQIHNHPFDRHTPPKTKP